MSLRLHVPASLVTYMSPGRPGAQNPELQERVEAAFWQGRGLEEGGQLLVGGMW
jgi:hypothetical protein